MTTETTSPPLLDPQVYLLIHDAVLRLMDESVTDDDPLLDAVSELRAAGVEAWLAALQLLMLVSQLAGPQLGLSPERFMSAATGWFATRDDNGLGRIA